MEKLLIAFSIAIVSTGAFASWDESIKPGTEGTPSELTFSKAWSAQCSDTAGRDHNRLATCEAYLLGVLDSIKSQGRTAECQRIVADVSFKVPVIANAVSKMAEGASPMTYTATLVERAVSEMIPLKCRMPSKPSHAV